MKRSYANKSVLRSERELGPDIIPSHRRALLAPLTSSSLVGSPHVVEPCRLPSRRRALSAPITSSSFVGSPHIVEPCRLPSRRRALSAPFKLRHSLQWTSPHQQPHHITKLSSSLSFQFLKSRQASALGSYVQNLIPE